MAFVADYSWARPSPQTLLQNNFIGVMRYLGPGTGGRDLTLPELRTLHNAGLGVGLIWETTATNSLAGYAAGSQDAIQANYFADLLGVPRSFPIFFAVDTDVSPAQVRGAVADTFRGRNATSSREVRAYGECDVLDILHDLDIAHHGWQCYAWSTGRKCAHRCLFQEFPPILNQSVDRNQLGPAPTDFLWHPTISYDRAASQSDYPYHPPALEEDDMPYSVQELHDIAKGGVIDALADSIEGLTDTIKSEGEATRAALLKVAVGSAKVVHVDIQALAELVKPGTVLPTPSVNE